MLDAVQRLVSTLANSIDTLQSILSDRQKSFQVDPRTAQLQILMRTVGGSSSSGGGGSSSGGGSGGGGSGGGGSSSGGGCSGCNLSGSSCNLSGSGCNHGNGG